MLNRLLPAKTTLLLLAANSLAFSLTAQAQDRREPIRGSAAHADGSVWSGATVHLLARPMPLDERFGMPDELTAVTDAKGRFTVKPLIGYEYLAWATEELADDRYRCSHPIERVIAGGRLELRVHEERPHTVLTFERTQRWRAKGALVATLRSTTRPCT